MEDGYSLLTTNNFFCLGLGKLSEDWVIFSYVNEQAFRVLELLPVGMNMGVAFELLSV